VVALGKEDIWGEGMGLLYEKRSKAWLCGPWGRQKETLAALHPTTHQCCTIVPSLWGRECAQRTMRKLGVVVHACNPSPGEVEAGYETGDQPGLCNETLSQRQNKTRPQGCFFGERE
jgi:hypothetical protein